MNPRIKKVNELIKEEVAKVINKDVEVSEALITVTRADTSPDLNQTKVYISVIPEKKAEEAMKELNNQIYDIQQKINKRLNMRPVPRIRFEKEHRNKEAARVEAILKRLDKD